jgi:O-acetyl-ADP-ribose deacetylase (regulator of RNase III)
MPTTFTKGDLFHTPDLHAYAFGTNAKGTMEGGIALAARKRWPRIADTLNARVAASQLQLGDVVVHTEGKETVYALVLQPDAMKKAKLTSLSASVARLLQIAAEAKIARVGISHPGTGKAALEWKRVKRILTELGEASPVELVVFEQFVRAGGAKGAKTANEKKSEDDGAP